MRLLYVDDMTENFFFMENLIIGRDIELFTAINGVQALEIMENNDFDVIVTDIMMPEMDGFTLCRKIITNPRYQKIPIIVLTGTYTSNQDAKLALQLGVDEYITKPCDHAFLLRRILELGVKGKEAAIPDFSDAKKEENMLSLFNRRLVRKLEQKAHELEVKVKENEIALDSLKHSQLLLRATQELAKLSGWEFDLETRKLRLTQRIYNIEGQNSKDRIYDIGEYKFTYVNPEDEKRNMRLFQKMVEDNTPFESEFWLKEEDGNEIFCRAAAEIDRENDVVIGILQDFTEQKLLEMREESLKEQLIQAQKLEAIGQLAGGIAHDFNNVLTVILGYAEEIMAKVQENDTFKTDAGEIVEAANRASLLTRQLLTFSSRQESTPKLMNINDTLLGIQKLLNRLIGEDVKCTFDLQEGIPNIVADQGQIEQIAMNLVINAREAMPMGGEITIKTFSHEMTKNMLAQHAMMTESNYVVLTVEDTGSGMDQETINNIFDPFFSTKERGYSSGLGLSTVYGIVTQYGGHIHADSAPGKGALFTVMLPVRDGVEEKPEPVSSKKRIVDTKAKVIVVEDDRAIGVLTAKIVARLGFESKYVGSAKETLDLIEAGYDPDLVITDVVMPQINGLELTAMIRYKYPHIKILMMSGYDQNMISKQGERVPGVPFMAKPFTRAELGHQIAQLLEQE